MTSGHEAFEVSKAAQPPKYPGRSQEVGGGLLVAHAGVNAPVLHTGTKNPRRMVSASPKRQAGRYQGELVGAMKEGKVPSNSTLRVLKTPSGRYLNAGGTHRHIAREAMGQGTSTNKIEVKSLGFEPRQSLVERAVNRGKVAQLSRASKKAAAGKPVKPVSHAARALNHDLAHAADVNDDAFWHSVPRSGGMASHVVEGAHAAQRARLGSSAVMAGLGVGLAGMGALEHHETKKKQGVVKAVNGHDGFEISKRENRDSSVGRDVTGALFPGWHGAIMGKPGHKLKAAGYELGGAVGGSMVAGPPGGLVGAGVGTRLASKKGHYQKLPKKKVAKRDFSAGQREKLADKGDALPDGSFPIKTKGDLKNAERLEGRSKHPAEVAALIERKKAELSKAATGHDVFLLEDVEKAFSLGGAMDAMKAVRPGGLLRDAKMGFQGNLGTAATGGHQKAFDLGMKAQGGAKRMGKLVRQSPIRAMGVAGGAGLGTGYLAGKN